MKSAQTTIDAPRFRPYTRKHIDAIAKRHGLTHEQTIAMKAVSWVLPFRTNEYVLEHLIDWGSVPDDPIFQLTIPQAGMLDAADFAHMSNLVRSEASTEELKAEARKIQDRLNPHPAGQMQLNVPQVNGIPIPGMQHKYRETVLFFPTQGQTCHAYCTYCFRWAQFVGIEDLKFANKEPALLREYLMQHPEVKSLLLTGGDPMVMSTKVLSRYIDALLEPGLEHVQSIRIGTKAVAYWPQRFVTDPDADELLRLFERVSKSGKHLALMGHYSHPRELETEVARTAVRRIIDAGATVRCQAPLIRHVNDDADAWSRLWNHQLRLGAVPYYMFIERDTGPKHYFEVPLARAYDIFSTAYQQVSGLGRTVRGPSMSATPGKVLVDGVTTIGGQKVFVLKMIQGRNPEWANTVFFAKFDPDATWLDDLQPAFGESSFFFHDEARAPQRQLPILRDIEPDSLSVN